MHKLKLKTDGSVIAAIKQRKMRKHPIQNRQNQKTPVKRSIFTIHIKMKVMRMERPLWMRPQS